MKKGVFVNRGRFVRVMTAAGAVLVTAPLALAQVPTMPAIDLPIDGASVVTAVIAIGVVVLLLYAGPKIGFRLGKALIAKLGSVVGR